MKFLMLLIGLGVLNAFAENETSIFGKISSIDSGKLNTVTMTTIKRSIPWDSINSLVLHNTSDYTICFRDEEAELITMFVSCPEYKDLTVPIFNDANKIEMDIFLVDQNSRDISYAVFQNSESRNSKFSSLYFKIILWIRAWSPPAFAAQNMYGCWSRDMPVAWTVCCNDQP